MSALISVPIGHEVIQGQRWRSLEQKREDPVVALLHHRADLPRLIGRQPEGSREGVHGVVNTLRAPIARDHLLAPVGSGRHPESGPCACGASIVFCSSKVPAPARAATIRA